MKVSDEKVNKIFNSLNLKIGRIIPVEVLSNLMYKIETKWGNYYLKVYKNKSNKEGEKLAKLYPFLLKKNIPVPKVLSYDDSYKIISHKFIILSEVTGKSLKESYMRLSKEKLKKVCYNLGREVAKIHSINLSKFGETIDGKKVSGFSETSGKGPFNSWKEMHLEIVKARLKILKNSYFDDLRVPLKEWFKKNSKQIDYKIVPRLLHVDLNQKNIFIDDKGNISGLIDFDNSFVGHNEEELMRTELAIFHKNKDLEKEFFRGYTKILKLDEGYKDRKKFYYFSRLLVQLECVVEYGENYVKDLENEQRNLRKEIGVLLKN